MRRNRDGATGQPACQVLPSVAAVTVETLTVNGGSGGGDAPAQDALSNELANMRNTDTNRNDWRRCRDVNEFRVMIQAYIGS